MSKAEQYIKASTRHLSNELVAVESRAGKEVISYHEWLTPEAALEAVRIAREEVIEKAATWFANRYQAKCSLDANDIEDFRKAMEKGE